MHSPSFSKSNPSVSLSPQTKIDITVSHDIWVVRCWHSVFAVGVARRRQRRRSKNKPVMFLVTAYIFNHNNLQVNIYFPWVSCAPHIHYGYLQMMCYLHSVFQLGSTTQPHQVIYTCHGCRPVLGLAQFYIFKLSYN